MSLPVHPDKPRTITKTKKRASTYVNIPVGQTPNIKTVSPVDANAINHISITRDGVVRHGKGTIYYDENADDELKTIPLWGKVVVRDVFGNIVEMVKSSDEDDSITTGEYINNQTIRSIPSNRIYAENGSRTNRKFNIYGLPALKPANPGPLG